MSTGKLDHYRSLPYEREWEEALEDNEVYYVVRVKDILRIAGGGNSRREGLQILRQAFDDYIEWRLEEGLPISLPAGVWDSDSFGAEQESDSSVESMQREEDRSHAQEETYIGGERSENRTGPSEVSESYLDCSRLATA